MTPEFIRFTDGTTVELTHDETGWSARHEDNLIFVCVVGTDPRTATPSHARWIADE